jgi:hypothetical protein
VIPSVQVLFYQLSEGLSFEYLKGLHFWVSFLPLFLKAADGSLTGGFNSFHLLFILQYHNEFIFIIFSTVKVPVPFLKF